VGEVGTHADVRGEDGRLIGLPGSLAFVLPLVSKDEGAGCNAASEPRRNPDALVPVCVGRTGNCRAATEGEGTYSSTDENELDAAMGWGNGGKGGRAEVDCKLNPLRFGGDVLLVCPFTVISSNSSILGNAWENSDTENCICWGDAEPVDDVGEGGPSDDVGTKVCELEDAAENEAVCNGGGESGVEEEGCAAE
jgi:hypothetical protein